MHSINLKDWTRLLQVGEWEKQKVLGIQFDKNSNILNVMINVQTNINYEKQWQPTKAISLHKQHYIEIIITRTDIQITVDNDSFAHKAVQLEDTNPIPIHYFSVDNDHCPNITITNFSMISHDGYCMDYDYKNCVQFECIKVEQITPNMTEQQITSSACIPSNATWTFFSKEMSDLERGKVFGKVHLKENIMYDFHIKMNSLLNYQTSILHVGDGMHNLGSFQLHGFHLIYFVKTVGARDETRYDIMDVDVGRVYHIQIIHTTNNLIVIVDGDMIKNETLIKPQRRDITKYKHAIPVYGCNPIRLECAAVSLCNLGIYSMDHDDGISANKSALCDCIWCNTSYPPKRPSIQLFEWLIIISISVLVLLILCVVVWMKIWMKRIIKKLRESILSHLPDWVFGMDVTTDPESSENEFDNSHVDSDQHIVQLEVQNDM